MSALSELRRREEQIFATPTSIPAIDLRADYQLSLVEELAIYYADQPFEQHRSAGLRYYFENDFFGYGDALVLQALLRHLRPARVIEVGSGFSSAVMLDTADRFLGDATQFTFIEPYAGRLDELLRGGTTRAEIVRQPLQDVDPAIFGELQARDVLLIDPTHVAKAGSDVNRLVFEVLPTLRPGVFVHFHDILYPFEYPADWVKAGRSWNEAYLLRAFLLFNDAYRIVLWNSFLAAFHATSVATAMPLWGRNPGGSLWLERS